jgi:hypothetical protein
MRLDRHRDELSYPLRYRQIHRLRQFDPNDLHDFPIVAIDGGGNERFFTGGVLIERTNADTCHFGGTVCTGSVETFPYENASGCQSWLSIQVMPVTIKWELLGRTYG